MNISQDFSLTASVWDGDKFLIEAATANGSRQMKVTAEVVRAYLNGTAGPSSATDRRLLPFRGFMDSGKISPSSVSPARLLEVWFVRSAARFAVAERSFEPVSSSAPPKLYDNWEDRSLYNDGLSPAAGNLFVCQSDDRPYWWTGAELRPIVTDTTGQVIAIPLDEIDAITAAASRPSSSSPAKSPASTAPAAEEAEEAKEAASQEEAPAAVAEPVAETTEEGTEERAEEEAEPKAAELIDTTLRSASLVDTTLRSATIIDKSKRSADVTTVTPSARIITVG